MKVRWRHRVEYAFVRGLCALFRVIPIKVSFVLAAGLAHIIYYLFPKRPAEARRRIAQVLPELSRQTVNAIARTSLRNLFFSAIETVKFPKLSDDWISRHLDVGNFPANVEAHIRPGRGALFVIPHMGNWELAGLAAGRRGLPMFFIVGRQRNPLSEGYLRSVRTATGLEYIARDEKSSRLILRRLKEGKIFGILPDVRMRTAGVPVRLFGHPADLPGGVAAFARHADVPIFLGHVRRVGWTRHVWDFEPPMWIDRNADIEAETTRVYQRIADYFTSIVRRYPDQYFWYNKRWILEPRNY